MNDYMPEDTEILKHQMKSGNIEKNILHDKNMSRQKLN